MLWRRSKFFFGRPPPEDNWSVANVWMQSVIPHFRCNAICRRRRALTLEHGKKASPSSHFLSKIEACGFLSVLLYLLGKISIRSHEGKKSEGHAKSKKKCDVCVFPRQWRIQLKEATYHILVLKPGLISVETPNYPLLWNKTTPATSAATLDYPSCHRKRWSKADHLLQKVRY